MIYRLRNVRMGYAHAQQNSITLLNVEPCQPQVSVYGCSITTPNLSLPEYLPSVLDAYMCNVLNHAQN